MANLSYFYFENDRMKYNCFYNHQTTNNHIHCINSSRSSVCKMVEHFASPHQHHPCISFRIDGLAHNFSISIANALEILQSCTKQTVWYSFSAPLLRADDSETTSGTGRCFSNSWEYSDATVCSGSYAQILNVTRRILKSPILKLKKWQLHDHTYFAVDI